MIKYLKGDATQPVEHRAVICHVCNDKGGWGKGFVLALSKRWPEPEQAYRAWSKGEEIPVPCSGDDDFVLGGTQFVPVENDWWVANMIAQHDFLKKGEKPGKVFLQYDDLNEALKKTAKFAKEHQLTVHMPRIGCGLAGGSWDLIEPLIETNMGDIDVYVYDFE